MSFLVTKNKVCHFSLLPESINVYDRQRKETQTATVCTDKVFRQISTKKENVCFLENGAKKKQIILDYYYFSHFV
jgi:hypothetical protein